MRHGHLSSGGRYPVLRALAILYFIGACGTAVGGVALAIWFLVHGDPYNVAGGRVWMAIATLGGAFFAVLAELAIAEMIKLFMDVERSARLLAISGTAAIDANDGKGVPAALRDGGRLPSLVDEETAEGALLRGR